MDPRYLAQSHPNCSSLLSSSQVTVRTHSSNATVKGKSVIHLLIRIDRMYAVCHRQDWESVADSYCENLITSRATWTVIPCFSTLCTHTELSFIAVCIIAYLHVHTRNGSVCSSASQAALCPSCHLIPTPTCTLGCCDRPTQEVTAAPGCFS